MRHWLREGLLRLQDPRTWWTLIGILIAVALWQFFSLLSKPYLFPGFQIIAQGMFKTLAQSASWRHIAASVARIMVSLAIAGMFGAMLGLVMGLNRRLEDFCYPIVRLLMGIPALSFVLLVVIWLRGMEFRIFGVMLLIVFPILTINTLDGVKSVSQIFQDMMFAFRAERRQIIFDLIIPTAIPFILSGAKIAAALSVRLVVFAELLGARRGIGAALYDQFVFFKVDLILVWTIILMCSAFLFGEVISAAERRLLHWRPEILREKREQRLEAI